MSQLRRRSARSLAAALALVAVACGSTTSGTAGVPIGQPQPAPAPATAAVSLPNRAGSLKFAVIGDFGNASTAEYQTAEQVTRTHVTFPFELVVLVGDNLYGSQGPQDYQQKFEIPYQPLLDAGVRFYGALGNHDVREQRSYALFNMDGHFYYTFKAPKQKVRFFVLESTYLEPDQVQWIEQALATSTDDWKIVYFHHPLYSSSGTHGSDLDLRAVLEPLFIEHNVSVVLNGHDHVYERIKPQHGIAYFVVGSGGQLRSGDLKQGSALTAKGFDTDNAFMLVEVAGDEMFFNAVSRTGAVVDSGVISRRVAAK